MLQTVRTEPQHRAILQRVARLAMIDRGLLPAFPDAVEAEVRALEETASAGGDPSAAAPPPADETGLLWASIDNDDSRDLDQLTVAEGVDSEHVRIRVAVADVDSLVRDGSAVDAYARHNTTSV